MTVRCAETTLDRVKYYRKNIGDFNTATQHLTLVERGAYNALIDAYYATEKPLPADSDSLYRIVGALQEIERAAVQRVAGEFFVLQGDRLYQQRIEDEIIAGTEKRDRLRANGRQGGVVSGESRAKLTNGEQGGALPGESRVFPSDEANASPVALATGQAKSTSKTKQLPKHNQQTTDNRQRTEDIPPTPRWLPTEDWEAFLAHRVRRKKPMSPEAIRRCFAELDRLRGEGSDPSAVLSQSIINDWIGVFAVKRQSGVVNRRVDAEIRRRSAVDEFIRKGEAIEIR